MIIFGVKGHHNSGKTFLIQKLTEHFLSKNLTVSVHKHTNKENIEFDKPGKDSWRIMEAGVTQIGLSYENGFFYHSKIKLSLEKLLSLNIYDSDILIIEGFKQSNLIPSILCLTDLGKNNWNKEVKKSNIFAISGIIPTFEMKCNLSNILKPQGFSFFDPESDLEELAQLCLKNAINKNRVVK